MAKVRSRIRKNSAAVQPARLNSYEFSYTSAPGRQRDALRYRVAANGRRKRMTHDIAIIGGGIVGLGTALALSEQTSARLVVLEAEGKLAAHQTGHNSGVIHSGLYYKPGSLKAKNCAEGRELMYRYCAENGIAHERCGKVVVATAEHELPALAELERRGAANGLTGIRRLGPEQIREHEPHVA